MNDICFTSFLCVNPYLFWTFVAGLVIFYLYGDKIFKQQVVNQLVRMPEAKNKKFYDRIFDVLEPPYRTYDPKYPNVHDVENDPLPSYQPMGYIYRSEGDPNYNTANYESNKFSLFGRPRYYGSNQYEYYVVDDRGIKTVIGDKMNELYDGDTVNLQGYEGSYTAEIYDTEGARYNPWAF